MDVQEVHGQQRSHLVCPWYARGMPSRLSVVIQPEVLKRTPNQNWRLLADAGKVRKSEPRTPYIGG